MPDPSPLRLVPRPSDSDPSDGPRDAPSDARDEADAAVVEAILDGLPPAGRVFIAGDDGWLATALATLGADVAGPGTADLDEDLDVVAFPLAPAPEGAVAALSDARRRLGIGGRVVVQSAHPACLDPYADGPTRMNGLPAYGRTLASWVQTLASAGLVLRSVREPLDSATGRPAGLVLVAEPEP